MDGSQVETRSMKQLAKVYSISGLISFSLHIASQEGFLLAVNMLVYSINTCMHIRPDLETDGKR